MEHQYKKHFGLLLALTTLLTIAAITFSGPSGIHLVRFNILIPFVLITLSLTLISYGLEGTSRCAMQYFNVLFNNRASSDSSFEEILHSIKRYGFIANLLWIFYAATYVTEFQNYEVNALISRIILAGLYVILLSEVLIEPIIRKNKHLLQAE